MRYLPLSKFKYNNDGTGRKSPQALDAAYRDRLSWPSTVQTAMYPALANANLLDSAAAEQRGVSTSPYPIFWVETSAINLSVSQIQRLSAQIRRLSDQLPPVAIDGYLKSLLKSEIIFTNEIEGVKTNPHEIGTIIGNLQQRPNKVEKRLESTIRKYNDAISSRMRQITQLSDYRAIYDELLRGEIPTAKLPDGKLFRDSFAYIGTATQAQHIPPTSEAKIRIALEQLITFMNDDQIIPIEKAAVTHFMFENTHPFTDGNGRTGRYLLSSYLSNKLDPFTGLSVSTAIHNELSHYYRLFQEADNIENRAELTFFVEGLLHIIARGQNDVIQALVSRRDQLDLATRRLDTAYPDLDDEQRNILYMLLQSHLFTESTTYGIQDREIVAVLKQHAVPMARTKRHIDALTAQGLITRLSAKPLQHVLSKHVLTRILPPTDD